MPTLIKKEGFAVMIYTHDHQPKHVHVFKSEQEVVINLEEMTIREIRRMKPSDVRKAWEIVGDSREFLLNEWDRIDPIP